MDQVTFEDAVMQEEIFGPVMPVLTFDSIEEVIRKVNSMAHPLALYIFAQDKAICEKKSPLNVASAVAVSTM